MFYAVWMLGDEAKQPPEFEVLGFSLRLNEAFALLMGRVVNRYRFERQDGLMRLHVEADGPREALPCDYLTAEELMTSWHPDDATACADIMKRAGSQNWFGHSMLAHAEPYKGSGALLLHLKQEFSPHENL